MCVVTEEIVLMPKDKEILLMLSTNIKDGSIKRKHYIIASNVAFMF